MRTEGLFPKPRPPKGPHERALDTALRSWRRDDHLTGDAYAAHRATLRELARRADHAIRLEATGEVTPYSATMCAREFRAALDDYAPAVGSSVDLELEAIAAAARASMADVDPA